MSATGIKRIGFGCARITTSPSHQAALLAALKHGIRLFDTAPNYGHAGASERAVGQALATHFSQHKGQREEVTVCTKFGYYQAKEGEAPGPESVPVGEEGSGLHFSLHPEVMEQELSRSLERLQLEAVDVLYVHNPEHCLADILLKHEIQQQTGGNADEAKLTASLQEERLKLKDKLVRAFEALEGAVASGKIRHGYGVSSNGFALNPKESLHLPLSMVLDAATEGAKRVGKDTPSLRTIQLPLNLLEPGGLVTASQARAKGLEVIANRPLTAVSQGGLYRLVNTAAISAGGPPEGYMEACRGALDLFNPTSLFEGKEEKDLTEEELETREGCRIIQELIRDMNRQLTSFTSTEAYTQELERRIIPMIASTFESLDEDAADALQSFFGKYGEMVRYHAAMRAVEVCRGAGHVLAEGGSLHEYALKWLLEKVPKQLTGVLVGMPQEAYVHDVARIASSS